MNTVDRPTRRRWHAAVRRFAFRVLRRSLLPELMRRTLQRRRITVLIYHNPDPETFRAHCRVLRSRYTIVSLQEFVTAFESRGLGELPDHALLITLDDGYRENHRLLPVLRSDEIPITIFVCSGVVGSNRHFWFTHARTRALWGMSDEDRVAALRAAGFTDVKQFADRQALSDEEVLMLQRASVEIQSHTISHPNLPKCSDVKAEIEIAGSRRDLEGRYECDVVALAYPNGECSTRDAVLVERAGYRCAFTADPGFITEKSDRFRLKRICIADDDGIDELIVKVSGLWRAIGWSRAT